MGRHRRQSTRRWKGPSPGHLWLVFQIAFWLSQHVHPGHAWLMIQNLSG
ncbi:hypothetical protein P3T29_005522 [Kitasatospora sp. MAP5-34]|nr:hypothetical protein [Kitasatospora sp. MAP5-34]